MAYQKTKINADLGKQINEFLISKGVETPTIKDTLLKDNKEKIEKIEYHMTEVWKTLGMDLSDDSLIETPNRIAKMMVLDHYWGLLPENFPKNTTILNKIECDEMVTLSEIPIMSNCEHHGIVFVGSAIISYIPDKKVIGLSKISRVAEYFSRRPQVQERLTTQIYYALNYLLGTENIAVSIKAQHYCMISRGVESSGTWTTTSKLGGVFKSEPEVRAEFFSNTKHK